MDGENKPSYVPRGMQTRILLAVLAVAYPLVVRCALSTETEVIFSCFGSFVAAAACFGLNTRSKLMAGNIAYVLVVFFRNRAVRALFVGAVSSYMQTCSEIYASSLSLKKFRADALCLHNSLVTILSLVSFFAFAFVPHFLPAAMSPYTIILSALVQSALIFFLIDPPVEIAMKKNESNVLLLGSAYQELVRMFGTAPFGVFRDEYSSLVSPNERPVFFTEALYLVWMKVNCTFIYVGAVGAISLKNKPSLLLAFVLAGLFVWILSRESPGKSHATSIFISTLLVFFLFFICESPFSALVMAFCTGHFTPSEESFQRFSPAVIAVSNGIRGFLSGIVAAVLLSNYIYLHGL
jgi:hypothetical protein